MTVAGKGLTAEGIDKRLDPLYRFNMVEVVLCGKGEWLQQGGKNGGEPALSTFDHSDIAVV